LLLALPGLLLDPLPVSGSWPVLAVPEPEDDGDPLDGGLAGVVVAGWLGVAVPIVTPTCCGAAGFACPGTGWEDL
jgi:hypothetical protein